MRDHMSYSANMNIENVFYTFESITQDVVHNIPSRWQQQHTWRHKAPEDML